MKRIRRNLISWRRLTYRASLRWQVTLLLGTVMVFQLGYLHLFWMPSASELTSDSAKNRTQDHLFTLGESLVPFLLQRQVAAANETLRPLVDRQPSWHDLVLTNAEGVVIFPLGGTPIPPSSNHIRMSHTINYGSHTLGELMLNLDLEAEMAGQIRQNRKLALTISFFTLASLMLVGFAVELLVIRPVRGLRSSASAIAEGDYDADKSHAAAGEVGDLVTAFTSMRDEISRQQENLRGAKEEAVSASNAKSQFLATMSHEIRTPMNGIIAVAHLLNDLKLPKEQATYTDTILKSAEHLLSVINDILDFSKIEAGRLELAPRPFMPEGMVSDLGDLMRPLAETHDVDFVVTSRLPRKLTVCGDPERLRQVILNLANNAIKFSHGGSVALEAGVVSGNPDTVMVRFSVTDTGIGMSEEVQSRLFGRFMQADPTHARLYGGTGLGLAICKQLVNLMGGEIGVTSEPGVGSCFWFEIPFPTARPKDLPASLDSDRGQAHEALNLNLLVVEDNPTNQFVARRILEKAGHRVTIAENGAEGLETLATDTFDIVLMDMQMPVMDGLTAARAVRASDAHFREVPIIALTANASTESQEECRQAGMHHFMCKPINPRELKDLIEVVMSESTTAAKV